MPVAFIGPEELYRQPGPYSAALEAAGFELLYPDDPTFTRGLVGDQATIEQLRDCDAILAGGEFFRESVLAALPRLRVIALRGRLRPGRCASRDRAWRRGDDHSQLQPRMCRRTCVVADVRSGARHNRQ